MQWLAQICVRRPVFAGVLMLVIVVLGGVGYTRLGLDQFPNIDLPFVRDYEELAALQKLRSTYLGGLLRETVNGFVHPVIKAYHIY